MGACMAIVERLNGGSRAVRTIVGFLVCPEVQLRCCGHLDEHSDGAGFQTTAWSQEQPMEPQRFSDSGSCSGGALAAGLSAFLMHNTGSAPSALHFFDDLTIVLAASAIMAAGAGISGFILLSVERS